LVAGLLGSATHGDETWDWFKENFATFIKRKVPDVRLGGVPSFARNFCSLKRHDEVLDFFTNQSHIIPGYERSLKQTLERIQLCRALKKEKGQDLEATLKNR